MKDIPLTPNDIEVLLHYHCSSEPHPRFGAPAVTDTVQRFIDLGVLTRPNLTITPLGAAWVKALCATPMPRLVYVNDRNEILE